MHKHLSFSLIFCFLFFTSIHAQTQDTLLKVALDSVVVNAYGSKTLMATPAAVNKIGTSQLQRYANGNILQAVNATPGVRMEERSPGSYRLNIRGSSVRSPYGVRNVKIYYDGIPFTAPGGNSMLNMLGFYNIGGIEVIKGPGSSLYGAGTGGVVLFDAPQVDGNIQANAGLTVGSFGALNYNLQLQLKNHQFGYEEASADGYREHTEMKRRLASYQAQLPTFAKGQLSLHFIYSDLNYQTPGALTLAEYQANPRQARPTVGTNQGAVLANAHIHQKAALLGLTHKYSFSPKLSNTTSLYGFYNEAENPAIQNYELKKEPHWGGRTSFIYSLSDFSVHFGGELQSGDFTSKTFRNLQGSRGSQVTDDRLDLLQWMAFAQLNWQVSNWLFTAGASVNQFSVDFSRSSETPNINASKDFKAQIQPRFAALYKVDDNFAAYLNVTKGFSPPASSEIFADNNSYNLALQAEKGWNVEPGVRWNLLSERLFLDASYFHTLLSNSIVTRRDAAGANFYLNAGKTKQQGVEVNLSYQVLAKEKPLSVLLQGAYAWHHFRYDEFVQLNDDFSGNQLPGVAPRTYTVMADVNHKSGWFGFVSLNHNSKIALNDANTQYADDFQLVSMKLGYQKRIKNIPFQLFVGADNLLDQTYSLGNDINGFGGRYYNVAHGRSFYFGLKLGWSNNK
ncbi:TonB-dependent receptor family protein [Pedobacter xixiisoli]|uniref:Iron complex outermembrane recepter protein n=1 Tax=Pedobacter xixiisoli TaxID=1476464 RepID=A0A286AAK1_9SPHI|nr:TonB-dependent receptor [Pedobacter xixiisoli]SOD18936.1 iron complex outermembrane recepter protein [Pedobacter xixiisoli]